jgi:SAM-dependent methyltransferase
LTPPEGSLVVDIGSNDGALLRAFQALGMRVLGIDPAREIARRATEAGVETLPCFFGLELAERIRKERGPAAIVTANNLFANVDDLATMTAGIRRLLAPDGVFIFESFYLADLIRNMVFDFTYHEHLSYFSVKPLVTFFRSHGMELIDAQRVPTKGGSLRYSVQLAGGPRRVSAGVGELIDLEARLGIHGAKTFADFARKIDGKKSELLGRLDKLRRAGKTIAGYGASATTTTLVYHFALGGLLRFIADDNPVRHSLFSPGYHIPVLSPQRVYDEKVECLVILAWRYCEPIMQKHQALLAQGGHFIVPLPSVAVF